MLVPNSSRFWDIAKHMIDYKENIITSIDVELAVCGPGKPVWWMTVSKSLIIETI